MNQAILPGLLNEDALGPWLPVRAAQAAYEAVMVGAAPVVCLYGPQGGGKSHLLALAAPKGVLGWDNIHLLSQPTQVPLFHALQQALQGGARVVVASPLPVAQLTNLLPDIQSRLLLAPQLEVGLPDEAELRALMAHWAVGRQLQLPGAVADYVLARAERSPASLRDLLVKLDSLSLAEKRAITVPLAKSLLEQA